MFGKKKEKQSAVEAATNRTDQEDLYGTGFDVDGPDGPLDYDRDTAATIVDKILLNRPFKAVLAILLMAVVLPTVLYATLYAKQHEPETYGACLIQQQYWSECMPGRRVNASTCEKANCCWNNTVSACYHSVPARHSYWSQEVSPNPESTIELTPRHPDLTPLGSAPHDSVHLNIQDVTEQHISISLSSRVEAKRRSTSFNFSQVEVELDLKEGFILTLKRKSDETHPHTETMFSTKNGPLIASEGFWELALQFPHDTVVLGAGSVARGSLKLSSGNATFYPSSKGLTNGRPFMLCINQTGRAHGVLLESPGALEIVARPSNLVSIRSTAQDGLVMHVFTGNSPAEVIRELTSHIGRPAMPPYWSLGLHVCRDAARKEANNASVVFDDKAENISLPYDSDCVDDSALGVTTFSDSSDIIQRLDMLNKSLEVLIEKQRKFVLTLFPQIMNGSEAAEQEEMFLQGENSTLFLGLHRGEAVVYPDFKHEDAAEWFKVQLERVLSNLTGGKPEGLVLAENWPLNDLQIGDGESPPPYVPQGLPGSLSNGTVWWRALHEARNISHHEVHAHYGAEHAACASTAFTELWSTTNTRLAIYSASKGASQGATLSSWIGDEQPATWDGLKGALLSVLEGGLSGEPFSGGGAICGSRGPWSSSLCTRWSLLALTSFPTVRYHHAWGEPARDPTNMTISAARVVSRAARLRYQLLPYLYTLAHVASTTGLPIARAMALEFPKDNATWPLDEQIMVGSSLLVAPVLRPTDVAVWVYLPRPPTPWFYLQGGERVGEKLNNTGHVQLLASENEMIILLRGGHIVVMQEGNVSSSEAASKSPRQFVAALDCLQESCTATGDLYLDDGTRGTSNTAMLYLTTTEHNLTLTLPDPLPSWLCPSTPAHSNQIAEFTLYGVPPGEAEGPVTVDGEEVTGVSLQFDSVLRRLHITGLQVDWCKATSIGWMFNPEL